MYTSQITASDSGVKKNIFNSVLAVCANGCIFVLRNEYQSITECTLQKSLKIRRGYLCKQDLVRFATTQIPAVFSHNSLQKVAKMKNQPTRALTPIEKLDLLEQQLDQVNEHRSQIDSHRSQLQKCIFEALGAVLKGKPLPGIPVIPQTPFSAEFTPASFVHQFNWN